MLLHGQKDQVIKLQGVRDALDCSMIVVAYVVGLDVPVHDAL